MQIVLVAAAVLGIALAGSAEMLTKDDKSMILSHSESCLEESKVNPKLLGGLMHGDIPDEPNLKKHVFCILQKCKMISKDGKLQKSASLGKMGKSGDAGAAGKSDPCTEVKGDTPEEVAWNFFKCGFEKKNVHAPISGGKSAEDTGRTAEGVPAVAKGHKEHMVGFEDPMGGSASETGSSIVGH